MSTREEIKTPPHGNALLTLIGLGSAVVFAAGMFRCGRADFKRGTKSDLDPWENSGNTGVGCSGNESWAIFSGLISFVIVAILLIWRKFWDHDSASKSAPVVGAFLFIWWFIAALVLTFHGPFFLVSNGYLGAWIATIASIIYALEVSKPVHDAAARVSGERKKINAHMLVLIVASIVELIAAALFCKGGCTGFNAYAVAVGAASIFFCLVLVLDPTLDASPNHLNLSVAIILFVWWFVGAIILTFITPFVKPSNGFWATWVATFVSGFIAKESMASRAAWHARGESRPSGTSDPAAAGA